MNKKHLLFAGLLLLTGYFQAIATLPTDHEKRLAELKKIPDIHQRIHALNDFAWELYEDHPRIAEEGLMMALQLAEREKNFVEWGDALNVSATMKRIRGDYQEAEKEFQKALSFYKLTGEAERIAHTLGNLAIIYQNTAQYQKALRHYRKSYRILKELGLAENEGAIHLNLGALYQQTGNVAKAVESELTSLHIYQEQNDQNGIALAYNNIGVTLKEHGMLDSALVYYHKSLQVAESIDNQVQITICHLNIGTVLMKLNDLEEGQKRLQKALAMAQTLEYHRLQVHAYRVLGEIALRKKDTQTALKLARQSTNMAAESGTEDDITESMLLEANVLMEMGAFAQSNEQFHLALAKAKKLGQSLFEKDIYQDMAKAYARQNNFEEAYHYQQMLFQVESDSLLHSSILGQLSSGNQIHQKKQEIVDLKKNETESRKNYQSIIMGVLLIGLLIIGILISHHQHRTNRLLVEQNEAMEAKNRTLKQAHAELEQFFFATSHDLKGPLRSLGGHISLIGKRYRDLLDKSGQESMDYALSEVKHVYHLLSDLTAYAEVGKGLSPAQSVNLNKTLDRVMHELRDEIETAGARIESDQLPTLYGHAELFLPLFTHLIYNGIKFRQQDQPPVLHITYQRLAGQHLIHFSDNGIGIPMKYQEGIFDLFRRLHTRDQYEGTGIGLAICHKIVAQMHGRIDVQSVEGEGSTFTISLPA